MTRHELGIDAKSLKEDSPVEAEIDGKKLAVFLHAGKIYVLTGTCSHEGGPLYDGSIDDGKLICPWHSGAFEIGTGKADENTPWATDIVAYSASIDKASGKVAIEM